MKRFENPLAEMRDHQKHDRFVQNVWINHVKDEQGIYRGCMFGCIMQTDDNAIKKFCEKYSMPLWMGCLCEKIFENLNREKALLFPVQVLEKLVELPEDFDLEKVRHKIAVKRLNQLLDESDWITGPDSVIQSVINYHLDVIKGNDDRSVAAWLAKSTAAASAAASAARSVTGSAKAVTESAELAAASAARSVTGSAKAVTESAELAAGSARSVAWLSERDWLLEELTVEQ